MFHLLIVAQFRLQQIEFLIPFVQLDVSEHGILNQRITLILPLPFGRLIAGVRGAHKGLLHRTEQHLLRRDIEEGRGSIFQAQRETVASPDSRSHNQARQIRAASLTVRGVSACLVRVGHSRYPAVAEGEVHSAAQRDGLRSSTGGYQCYECETVISGENETENG